ncbi:MAG: YihY/virulence factor BrkB family protein, partial [Bacteroidota bacterium]
MTRTNWKAIILNSGPVHGTVSALQRVKPPGCHGYSLYSVLSLIWEGFHKGKLLTRASAISFKILLALAPTLILLFTLIPYIPVTNFQEDLIRSIEELLPASTFQLVEGTLTDLIAYKHDTFLSISFVLGLYYASNSIMAVFEGFNGSYHQAQQKNNPYRSRLIAVSLVFFLPVLILPPFVVITFSEAVLGYALRHGFLKEGIELVLIH